VNNRRKRCIDLAVKLNNVPVLLHLLSLRVNCEAFVYEDKYGVEKACKSPLLVACEKVSGDRATRGGGGAATGEERPAL